MSRNMTKLLINAFGIALGGSTLNRSTSNYDNVAYSFPVLLHLEALWKHNLDNVTYDLTSASSMPGILGLFGRKIPVLQVRKSQ